MIVGARMIFGWVAISFLRTSRNFFFDCAPEQFELQCVQCPAPRHRAYHCYTPTRATLQYHGYPLCIFLGIRTLPNSLSFL